MRNFKSLIKEANKEIQKAIAYIEENMEAFESTNLKLYDICWHPELQEKHNLSDEQYSNLFHTFCEIEFDWYQEWREEEKLQNEHNYIGRTSSFYFHDCNLIQYDRYGDLHKEYTVVELIINNIRCTSDLTEIINEDGLLDMDLLTKYIRSMNTDWKDCWIEGMKDDLYDLINDGICEMVAHQLEDVIKDYNYIKDFKDNQVENFDDFLYHQLEEYVA